MKPPIHLVVLMDAFGWQIAQRLEFMTDVLPHRGPLRTVLGYSSGAIPTMLTGKSPAEHGRWNLFYYDEAGSPFRWLRHARFLPERVLDNRVARKALKELGRRALGLGALFDCAVKPTLLPWFNWAEKSNIYETRGIPGATSIFDELAAAGIPHRVYTYHRYRDAEVFEQAGRDIRSGVARFFFLYLSEVDAFLHQHRTDDARIVQTFAWYERQLRDLLTLARRHDPDAEMTILSDHGMAPVRHHRDLARDINALGLTMPTDYLAVYDSTMARFWFFTDRARRRIVERLAQLRCGRTLTDDELETLGIRFSDRRYGDLVFLMEPGWLITSSDFNANGWLPAGMHGYHPDDPDSDAIFLSSREPSRPMRTIADAHAAMQDAAAIGRRPEESTAR
jgi:hypothetical protein